MNKRRVVIAGGNGFLGQSLTEMLLARGYEVVVLTRSPRNDGGAIKEIAWDGKNLDQWTALVDGSEAIINLAGKSVNCRYTPANRREINESRVNSVRVLEEAIRRCAYPPRVLVQAASLAIYGDAGDRWCDETAAPGQGFPVETCLLWENAFHSTPTARTRRVILRIGFVLGRNGGALKTLAGLTKWGLGGTVGNGRQYISWIHQSDMNQMFLAAIERDDLSGVFNATSPKPVPNAEFMRALRRSLHRPWSPPAPAWAVQIGSWFMRTEACLALTGRRCAPKRFLESGFVFQFPNLAPALSDILG
jgi:uncharacterized protein (TIGR01777 family)